MVRNFHKNIYPVDQGKPLFSSSNDDFVTFGMHIQSVAFCVRATDTGAKIPSTTGANIWGGSGDKNTLK